MVNLNAHVAHTRAAEAGSFYFTTFSSGAGSFYFATFSSEADFSST
jgi:hypothetical protein